ncbi:hypothetical protein OKW45_007957 [Paraburkholderia sp. WSM4175]|uniref:hypothetical protein n=1 Tax=Paraburkholderia sp. WSM4175 TaxID=2991072 RepID=UPI003D19F36B
MSTRIHGGQQPHVDQQAHDAKTGHAHVQQTHAHQGQVSHLVMQRKLRANKIQHNKALMAAFYRNKRFAESHGKDPSAAGQKLLRQLGTRPRPGAAGKPRDKATGRERPEDGAHESGQRHENDPNQDREQKHGRDHEHEHEHGQDQRGQKDGQQRDGQQRQQGQQQGRHGQQQGQSHGGQSDGQQQGQPQGQSQQQPQQQSQQQQRQRSPGEPHERRGRGDKPASFALKKAGGMARKTAVAPMRLQALAERQGASPTRAQTLADGYARELIGLGRELQGGDRHAQRQSLHLMLPLALLSACSRMAMKRQPAQLQAQINSALAQPGNGTVGARLLGHTLDLTLARQRFRIDYDDNEQSLSMVRQRLMDATAATAAPAAPGGVSGGVAAPSAPRSPGAS